MKNEREAVHVMISSPKEMRRTILNAALQTTSLLRSYENYAALRKKEERMKQELVSVCRELRKRVNELKIGTLPDVEEEKMKAKKLKNEFPEEDKEYASKIDSELQKLREKLSQL